MDIVSPVHRSRNADRPRGLRNRYRERTRPPRHLMRTMIDVHQRLALSSGGSRTYCSLLRLEKAGFAAVSRLPVSLREQAKRSQEVPES